MLANPPAPGAPMPSSLSMLLEERNILTRALELAQDEGRRVSVAALTTRTARTRVERLKGICPKHRRP